jgi:hypothetical protein
MEEAEPLPMLDFPVPKRRSTSKQTLRAETAPARKVSRGSRLGVLSQWRSGEVALMTP